MGRVPTDNAFGSGYADGIVQGFLTYSMSTHIVGNAGKSSNVLITMLFDMTCSGIYIILSLFRSDPL